ncbi:hypothetical protein PUN28_011968 [Cardiocondyla obscurior]|uniref:Uncharacterized protein n=1 Tax=Cardiocondyla obscurior TaxID=286306 RepID=A0AAW2FBB6_9HYME
MPADRGIHYYPRAEELTSKSTRFVGQLPFSLFVLRSAPVRTATALRNLLVVPVDRQWVKRDPILVNLIPGLGARHHPSRLGWARSRITPLQQTFSPRTMHPMPSPSPPPALDLLVSLCLALSLFLIERLISVPLRKIRDKRGYKYSRKK